MRLAYDNDYNNVSPYFNGSVWIQIVRIRYYRYYHYYHDSTVPKGFAVITQRWRRRRRNTRVDNSILFHQNFGQFNQTPTHRIIVTIYRGIYYYIRCIYYYYKFGAGYVLVEITLTDLRDKVKRARGGGGA